MCLEIAFKTGKSLRWSDWLWGTVPDCQTGNRKGSVSELGSCLWNNDVWQNEDTVMPGHYWQMQRILSGTRGSDCHEPWTSGVPTCTGSGKWLVASGAPSVPYGHSDMERDQMWPVQQHSAHDSNPSAVSDRQCCSSICDTAVVSSLCVTQMHQCRS